MVVKSDIKLPVQGMLRGVATFPVRSSVKRVSCLKG